jgi:CRISPR-associated protein Cmr2
MKYTGVTIGPIDHLMQQCRKTRHLWGTSYLISHLMKRVLHFIKEQEPEEFASRLLIPSPPGAAVKGAGIVPDNIVLESSNGQALLPLAIKAIEAAKKEMTDLLDAAQQAYFLQVVKIYAVEAELPPANPVQEINRQLHLLDLQMEYHSGLYEHETDWTAIIDKLNGACFFTEAQTGTPFPSLNLIATRPLSSLRTYQVNRYADEDAQDEFYEKMRVELKSSGRDFNNFYKYIALVVADGDKVSKTISAAGGNSEIVKELAAVFTAFAKTATASIFGFGAQPVYAGGDDLKFFSPLAKPAGQGFTTIFSLLDDIHSLFENELNKSEKLKKFYAEHTNLPRPSLSFGVHFSYYKYPLNEALEQAETNLHEAKRRHGGNAVCFTMRKHSGHYFGTVIDWKHETLSELLLPLLKTVHADKDFLSGIMHRMRQYRKLFKAIEHDEEKIKQFILNSYDETVHDASRDFLDQVAGAMVCAAASMPVAAATTVGPEPFYEPGPVNDYMNIIYSTLRFIHFINDTEDER